MKKKLVALAAAVATLALSAVMLAGCSGGGDAQQQGGDSGATDGAFTLTVGFDQGYPPYGYVGDDGQFTGFDLELAKAVCEKMGWNLDLQAIDWDAKDALIGSGTINCIWNGFTMEGREDKFTFSEPYMYNEQVVVVVADGLGHAALGERAGHARTLAARLTLDPAIGSGFPSTTAAALTTLTTGEPSGRHGLVGYRVFDPAQNRVINQLSGWEGVDPASWQRMPTVFERTAAAGIRSVAITHSRYRDSGFTRAMLRGAEFVGALDATARRARR